MSSLLASGEQTEKIVCFSTINSNEKHPDTFIEDSKDRIEDTSIIESSQKGDLLTKSEVVIPDIQHSTKKSQEERPILRLMFPDE